MEERVKVLHLWCFTIYSNGDGSQAIERQSKNPQIVDHDKIQTPVPIEGFF